MAETTIGTITPIKSLDELKQGDVVHIRVVAGESLGPHIISAIGEVPEHEKEVSLQQLYLPDTQNSKISYFPKTVKESQLDESEMKKLRSEDYKGWRYKTIQVVK